MERQDFKNQRYLTEAQGAFIRITGLGKSFIREKVTSDIEDSSTQDPIGQKLDNWKERRL